MRSSASIQKTLDMKKLGNLWVFLGADYSQIEIRFLAEISGDPLLIKQLNSGVDIHCLVGHELTGWPVEKIAKDKVMRRIIKTFHFALVYGVGEPGMYRRMQAEGLKVTKKQVHSYFQAYFTKYKGVKKFIENARDRVERLGYIDTLFGPFRRYINKNDAKRTTYWANQAVNSPIQGTAHQMVLTAIALHDIKPKTYSLLQNPIMEIHDALYWRVRLRDLQEATKQQVHLLQEGAPRYIERAFSYKMRVPLLAETEAGFCLGSMIPYNGERIEDFLKVWRAKHIEVEKKSWEDLFEQPA